MFKEQWFERCYEPAGAGALRLPNGTTVEIDSLSRFATVDLAASLRTTADYSVIATFGVTEDDVLLVLDVDRARREGPDLVPAMRNAVARWDLSSVWVEKSGFQLSLIQQAHREGLPVREIIPDRDKVSRALPATAAFEGGRVLLPRSAPWLPDLKAELLAFPNGAHDDQVDAVAYGVEVIRQLRRSEVWFDAW
jgi:predicted phage terminase large subunit-like protein